MEGDIEKGVINFRVQGKKDGKISFTISSALQVDMAIVPEKISRTKQAESWNEVLNNIIKLA